MKKVILTLTAVLAFAATSFAQAIMNGEYIIRYTKNPNYVLTLKDGKATNGQPVCLQQWNNSKAQRWKVIQSDAYVFIRSMVDENYVIEIKGGSLSNNAEIQVYQYHGGENQRWQPEQYAASYVLHSGSNKNFAVDLRNGNAVNGGVIQLYSLTKGVEQRWAFERIVNVRNDIQSLPEGEYYIKPVEKSYFYLTLKDGQASNNNIVQIEGHKGTKSQKWKITHKDGKIVIRSAVNNNCVLDVKDGVYGNYQQLQVYNYSGSSNQLWIPEKQKDGSYVLMCAANTGYALNRGYIVDLYYTHKEENQCWLIEPVNKSSNNNSSNNNSSNNNNSNSSNNNNSNKNNNTSNDIPDGEYIIKFAKNPDYVVTLKDGKAGNTNPIHLWQWKNDKSQRWKVTHKDGKIALRSMVDNNYVLDVKGGSLSNNAEIQAYQYHGGDNQLWIPEKQSNGTYVLMIAGNKAFCLDLYKGAATNGNKIELWSTHKGWQEQWIFEKVSSSNNNNNNNGNNNNNSNNNNSNNNSNSSNNNNNNNNNNTTNTQLIPEGEYVIKFAKNPDYVLTLKDGKATNINLVHLWKWKNDNSQKWKVTHKDGKIVIRSMVDNNFVMDVMDYVYNNNTQIIVYTYHGKDNQVWIPEQLNNGSYLLKTAGNQNFCLDLYNGNPVNDGKIQLYQAHKGDAQQWIFEKVGKKTYRPKAVTDSDN